MDKQQISESGTELQGMEELRVFPKGNRYVYKVVKHWPEKNKSGVIVGKYLFRRNMRLDRVCSLYVLC